MSYKKGLKTRAGIIAAAKNLFFEQGYQATTIRQLAKAANANPGLINYYFESKAGIGLIIYQQIRQALQAEFSGDGYSLHESFLLQEAASILVCDNSPEFCRFLSELYDDPATYRTLTMEGVNDLPKLFIPKRSPTIAPEHEKFIQMCISGSKRNLLHYLSEARKNGEGSSFYILDFIRLATELINSPDPDDLVQRCIEILDNYYLSVGPYMMPIIHKRHGLNHADIYQRPGNMLESNDQV